VGAFRDCIRNLTEAGLVETIVRSINKGKPYLGICLGLQVLFTESEEFGLCRGLDVFRGRVIRFHEAGLKVPHMGWNTVRISRRPPICTDIPDESYFYFVHSYYVAPVVRDICAMTTEYGIEFTSMVWKDNIFASQFHPEKSQMLGLKILKGFGDLVRKG
jgi:imidazole glycerol-phosphate synthase subunit HisH